MLTEQLITLRTRDADWRTRTSTTSHRATTNNNPPPPAAHPTREHLPCRTTFRLLLNIRMNSWYFRNWCLDLVNHQDSSKIEYSYNFIHAGTWFSENNALCIYRSFINLHNLRKTTTTLCLIKSVQTQLYKLVLDQSKTFAKWVDQRPVVQLLWPGWARPRPRPRPGTVIKILYTIIDLWPPIPDCSNCIAMAC